MDTSNPLASFDKAKPFHRLVMHYFVHMMGLNEVYITGLAASFPEDFARQLTTLKRDDEEVRMPTPDGVHVTTTGELHNLIKKLAGMILGPQTLVSIAGLDDLILDPLLLSSSVVGGSDANPLIELETYRRDSAGNMLLLAFEISKAQASFSTYEKEPIMEFLRHCRNAAAHGGNFNFLGPEPKPGAVWQKHSITRSLQGTPLFKTKTGGLLGTADPIYIMWDIEQAFPNLF